MFIEIRSYYVVQGVLELAQVAQTGVRLPLIFAPQSLECWDYRCVLPHAAVHASENRDSNLDLTDIEGKQVSTGAVTRWLLLYKNKLPNSHM